jgi:hypothetical protein
VGSLQNKKAELKLALEGQFGPHFRFLLGELLEDLSHCERKVSHLEERIRAALAPHGDVVARLCTIPTVEEVTAWTILAEIGWDMSAFPSAQALAKLGGAMSWQRRKRGQEAKRTGAEGESLPAEDAGPECVGGGAQQGLLSDLAVSADRPPARDEAGGDYHDRLHPVRTARRLIHRLKNLGYEVELEQLGISREQLAELDPRGRPLGSKTREPRRRRSGQPPPADSKTCPKCANWGIPCIHARNQIPKPLHSAPQHNQ